MSEIFVSYARLDRTFVDELDRELKSRGFGLFLDVDDIPGGVSWMEKIALAIQACRAFLLVLSGHSVKSRSVAQEVALAYDYDRPIVPVKKESCEIPPKMQLALAGVQYIDFELLGKDRAFGRLSAALPAKFTVPFNFMAADFLKDLEESASHSTQAKAEKPEETDSAIRKLIDFGISSGLKKPEVSSLSEWQSGLSSGEFQSKFNADKFNLLETEVEPDPPTGPNLLFKPTHKWLIPDFNKVAEETDSLASPLEAEPPPDPPAESPLLSSVLGLKSYDLFLPDYRLIGKWKIEAPRLEVGSYALPALTGLNLGVTLDGNQLPWSTWIDVIELKVDGSFRVSGSNFLGALDISGKWKDLPVLSSVYSITLSGPLDGSGARLGSYALDFKETLKVVSMSETEIKLKTGSGAEMTWRQVFD